MSKKEFNLFRRDNKVKTGGGYSFVIDQVFSLHQIKIACLKRDSNNARTDCAIFYFDYKKFRSVLNSLESRLKKFGIKAKMNEKFYGGNGKRSLRMVLEDGKLVFHFLDQTFADNKEYKNYTGKLLFPLSDVLDFQELVDVRQTINSWEMVNINKIIKNEEME